MQISHIVISLYRAGSYQEDENHHHSHMHDGVVLRCSTHFRNEKKKEIRGKKRKKKEKNEETENEGKEIKK